MLNVYPACGRCVTLMSSVRFPTELCFPLLPQLGWKEYLPNPLFSFFLAPSQIYFPTDRKSFVHWRISRHDRAKRCSAPVVDWIISQPQKSLFLVCSSTIAFLLYLSSKCWALLTFYCGTISYYLHGYNSCIFHLHWVHRPFLRCLCWKGKTRAIEIRKMLSSVFSIQSRSLSKYSSGGNIQSCCNVNSNIFRMWFTP